MNCDKCRFHGKICDGLNGQKGVPWPWNQWLVEDADLFHDKPWVMFPDVRVCMESPPKAIPQVDGRVNWAEDLEWVAVRLAQVFDTKRRKGGWKTARNLRVILQVPNHVKLYLVGTGKDDQLWKIMQDPLWAERIRDYGFDYASPLNFSMYNNSTACQIVWSLLMSWKSAKQLSDVGVAVIPNVEGPERVQLVHKNWVSMLKAPVIMSNFQMVYNRHAFARESKLLKSFADRFAGAKIILNGVTDIKRIHELNQVTDFSFVSATLFTYAQYRRGWDVQGGFSRAVSHEGRSQYVPEMFMRSFRNWRKAVEN